MSIVYISFIAPINNSTVQNLLGVTFQQIQQGASHIYYLFSSPGGEVDAGVACYNVLKSLPVETTMHNVGAVDSIGNAVFLGGKNRFSCPHATFMFHGVGFDVTSPMRMEEKFLRERLAGLQALQTKIGGIISDETSLKGKDVNRLFLEAQTKNANFALGKGIISEIRAASIPQGAATLQLVFQG